MLKISSYLYTKFLQGKNRKVSNRKPKKKGFVKKNIFLQCTLYYEKIMLVFPNTKGGFIVVLPFLTEAAFTNIIPSWTYKYIYSSHCTLN